MEQLPRSSILLNEGAYLLHAINGLHVNAHLVLPLVATWTDVQVIHQLFDHALFEDKKSVDVPLKVNKDRAFQWRLTHHHRLLLAAVAWITSIVLPITRLEIFAEVDSTRNDGFLQQ